MLTPKRGGEKSHSFTKVRLGVLRLGLLWRRPGADAGARVEHCTRPEALFSQAPTYSSEYTGFPLRTQ